MGTKWALHIFFVSLLFMQWMSPQIMIWIELSAFTPTACCICDSSHSLVKNCVFEWSCRSKYELYLECKHLNLFRKQKKEENNNNLYWLQRINKQCKCNFFFFSIVGVSSSFLVVVCVQFYQVLRRRFIGAYAFFLLQHIKYTRDEAMKRISCNFEIQQRMNIWPRHRTPWWALWFCSHRVCRCNAGEPMNEKSLYVWVWFKENGSCAYVRVCVCVHNND